jgi:hypothetical protein
MSLVTSASLWTNDESANKKRQSTIRKSTKQRQYILDNDLQPDEYVSQSENYQNLQPSNIDDVMQANQDLNTRVTDLLNKITSANTVDDNNKLGNFKPLTPPSLNIKKDMDDNNEIKQYVPPTISFAQASIAAKTQGNHQVPSYGADDMKAAIYSNYNKSYEPPAQLIHKPYYANMGISKGSLTDNKLMEKINYMIHLLEQQQHEKTNNITEEFILYTFLGVFIIFVVDSFARAGKYTR